MIRGWIGATHSLSPVLEEGKKSIEETSINMKYRDINSQVVNPREKIKGRLQNPSKPILSGILVSRRLTSLLSFALLWVADVCLFHIELGVKGSESETS